MVVAPKVVRPGSPFVSTIREKVCVVALLPRADSPATISVPVPQRLFDVAFLAVIGPHELDSGHWSRDSRSDGSVLSLECLGSWGSAVCNSRTIEQIHVCCIHDIVGAVGKRRRAAAHRCHLLQHAQVAKLFIVEGTGRQTVVCHSFRDRVQPFVEAGLFTQAGFCVFFAVFILPIIYQFETQPGPDRNWSLTHS